MVERLLFTTIMVPCKTVDITVDVDLGRAVSDRITCNGAVEQVPGDVICTGRLASEGVWAIWSYR